MVIPARKLAFRRRDGPLALRSEERDQRVLIVGVLDIELDEDAVAGGVGEDLQRELVHVQVLGFLAVGVAALGVFQVALDASPELYDPFVKVILIWDDPIFRLARDLDGSQSRLEAA